MATRANFGNCWAEVVANWCGGTAPPVEEEIAWDSLLTVEELWPEYLDKALTDGVRSRLVIADIVDYGRTLRACRNLNRFGKVVERLRGADKGALAELKFAAALVEAGYLPELEPELNGKKLDAVVVENRERVYVEVISPELSQAMQTAEQGIGILACALTACTPGLITDVHMLVDPNEAAIRQVLAFVLTCPVVEATSAHEIPGVAFLAIQPFDPRIDLIKSNFIDRGVPAIGIVSVNGKRSRPSLAMVRLPIDDQRAARLMEAETHQLSRDEINVLAIDVSNIPGGISKWIPLVERRFQPNLNRRFGAVVLFTRVNQLHNANIIRGYRVSPNPHAYRPVPNALLTAIRNLDRTP